MWNKGQKLVFVSNPLDSKYPYHCPKKGEIVTCDGYNKNGNVFLVEYCGNNPFFIGERIAFKPFALRPIEPRKDVDVDDLVRKFTIPEKLDVVKVPEIETA